MMTYDHGHHSHVRIDRQVSIQKAFASRLRHT
jgi:hypothetical protein